MHFYHFPFGDLWKHPRIGAVVFLLLATFGAYFSFKTWDEDRNAPDDPVPMTLQDAIDRSRKDKLWVALDDTTEMSWDCSSIVHRRYEGSEWMDVVATDPAQLVVIVVVLEDPLSCDELLERQPALTGELTHLKKSDYNSYDDGGRLSKYEQATTFLNLCTYCTPHQSERMFVWNVLFILVCLVPGVVCLYKGFLK